MTKMRYQFHIAILLFIIFGGVIIIAIILHKDEPENAISLAGIFSAWMGAIIAFYFMENRSSETVFSVKQAEEEIRNQLIQEQQRANEIKNKLKLEEKDDELKNKYWKEIQKEIASEIQKRDEIIKKLEDDKIMLNKQFEKTYEKLQKKDEEPEEYGFVEDEET